MIIWKILLEHSLWNKGESISNIEGKSLITLLKREIKTSFLGINGFFNICDT